MEKIRNIVFDLGGVLFNIDYQTTVDAFIRLGVKDFDKFFTQEAQIHLFDKFERGEVPPEYFREELRQLLGLRISDEQIDHAWNAMLLDFPLHHLVLLDGVRNNYRIFLLSNTNEIHYPVYQAYMMQTIGYRGLDHYFEQSYLSFKMRMRKPELRIFQHVLSENGLVAEETLFIDDTYQHVEGARKAGINALWLDLKVMNVTDLFNWRFQLRQEVKELC
ncbi:MAG TPA: HAD family phosphatase [Bacteroidales bacterium]|nr:HAD family phosphatase [Bacteroidales bacterium]